MNGKTGTREIVLFGSVPALKTWMNVHPVGKGAIWITLHKPIAPLQYAGLYEIVTNALNVFGLRVDKKNILHMFRHTRATELWNMGVRGIALQKFMGWSSGDMEQVYTHLSNADVNNEVRQKVYGLGPIAPVPAPLLSPRKCPRCLHDNDQKAVVCAECNLPLSNDLIVQTFTDKVLLEQKVETLTRTLRLVIEKLGMNIQLPITQDSTISLKQHGVPESDQ